jgi:hypothetical protein
MTAYEDFVTEEVRKGRTILGLYPATDEQSLTDFAAWRKRPAQRPVRFRPLRVRSPIGAGP